MYTEVENKKYSYLDKNKQPNLPLTTPFIEKTKNIDRSMVKSLFDLVHADIADFLVNLLMTQNTVCSSWIILPLKFILIQWKKKTFEKKLEQFYNNISEKRKG